MNNQNPEPKQENEIKPEISINPIATANEDSTPKVEAVEKDMVHLVVLHKKKPSGYSHKEIFGTPLVISIKKNANYRELYKAVVLKLSCGAESGSGGAFQVVPTVNIKYDEENIQSAKDQGKIPQDLVIPRSEIESEETKGPKFIDCSVFELLLLSMGSTEYFYNDTLPLKLKERQTIICLWPQKHYDYYYNNMTPEIPIEIDESCHFRQKEKKDVPDLTLERCLETFAEEEQLSPQDTWYCSDCKEHVQAYKKFTISRVPKLLIIHLKRFSYRGQHVRERIDDIVKFPLTDFDISKYVDEPHSTVMKYDLFAVSNHYGTMGGGHYTAFVRKRNDTSGWIKCDDSHVSSTSAQNIVTEAAYVLFYVRKDVEWPQFNETVVEVKEEKEEEVNDTDYEVDSGDYEENDEGEKNPDKAVSVSNNDENGDH